jgi:toxin ParE1/3/4
VRLVFAEPAARDLDDIIDYLAFDNPPAAKKVYRAIMTTVERLQDFPEIGHTGRLPAKRELSLTALPYIIVYEGGADLVTVLVVFHGPRDLAQALRERRKAPGQRPTSPASKTASRRGGHYPAPAEPRDLGRHR